MSHGPDRRPVVVLSTADLDAAVWTNKQHLAVGLAAGRDVVYVESLGLRRPGLRLADLRRVLQKVRRSAPRSPGGAACRPRPARLRVVTPRLLPLHGLAPVRALNRRLVRRSIAPHVPAGAVLWTFSPLTYGLEQAASHVVYHSVDLLHTLDGVPGPTLLAAERTLLRHADAVVASASGVRDHLVAAGADDVRLWENVAQTELFSGTSGTHARRVVFAGNLTPQKVDFGLLLALLERGVELDLAGPVAIDGSGGTALARRVVDHPLCRVHGLLDLPGLARLFAGGRVGLVPYHVNGYTRGVFPMKVYEYLSAGLSVVSTPLPSLSEPVHGLAVADAAGFADAVVAALDAWDEDLADGLRASAEGHSWTARIEQAERLLADLDAPAPAPTAAVP